MGEYDQCRSRRINPGQQSMVYGQEEQDRCDELRDVKGACLRSRRSVRDLKEETEINKDER